MLTRTGQKLIKEADWRRSLRIAGNQLREILSGGAIYARPAKKVLKKARENPGSVSPSEISKAEYDLAGSRAMRGTAGTMFGLGIGGTLGFQKLTDK